MSQYLFQNQYLISPPFSVNQPIYSMVQSGPSTSLPALAFTVTRLFTGYSSIASELFVGQELRQIEKQDF